MRVALDADHRAKQFLNFVNKTGSPYHSVAQCRRLLLSSKFIELQEGTSWNLERGKGYFVTRNDAAICAFHIGAKAFHDPCGGEPGKDGGFVVIAAHTDSPCLRVRPRSAFSREGFLQVGVETYGGGLWHTWFDRGLGFAGKVLLRRGLGSGKECCIESRLIAVRRPVCILPNLAIHLRTAEESQAFKIDKEAHLQPILCSETACKKAHTNRGDAETDKTVENAQGGGVQDPPPMTAFPHHEELLREIAQQCECDWEDIVDIDLCLMDATDGRVCGLHNEFIESPRLDNQVSTWASVQALCEYPGENPSASSETDVLMAVAFDHEEIGSVSFSGANSSALEGWIERITNSLKVHEFQHEIASRSILISADMAHAIHPNYADKHQPQHKPSMHKGIVIKENQNQRYSTQAESSAMFREIARRGSVDIQDFIVRNTSPCGSTVGPMLSARLGYRAIDVGIGQFAMHSCRELCGVSDLLEYINFFKASFEHFREIDSQKLCRTCEACE